MRVGVIDLDTSHPAAFLPLLRERGHDVVAVYGGTTVVDDAYTTTYAAERGIPEVDNDPADLLGKVDSDFTHGIDWDTHLSAPGYRVSAGAELDIHPWDVRIVVS